jgi:hypothetical protein
MSLAQDEFMTEGEVARYLGVLPERVRELASQGALRCVLVQVERWPELMYHRAEVFALKESLVDEGGKAGIEDWPEVIGE